MDEVLLHCPECPPQKNKPRSLDLLREHIAREHLKFSLYFCPECREGFVSPHIAAYHLRYVCEISCYPPMDCCSIHLLSNKLQVYHRLQELEKLAISMAFQEKGLSKTPPPPEKENSNEVELQELSAPEMEVEVKEYGQPLPKAIKIEPVWVEEEYHWIHQKSEIEEIYPSIQEMNVEVKKRFEFKAHKCRYKGCCGSNELKCLLCSGGHADVDCATETDLDKRNLFYKNTTICLKCGDTKASRRHSCQPKECSFCQSTDHLPALCTSKKYALRLEELSEIERI